VEVYSLSVGGAPANNQKQKNHTPSDKTSLGVFVLKNPSTKNLGSPRVQTRGIGKTT
jgi:hypothetical protein